MSNSQEQQNIQLLNSNEELSINYDDLRATVLILRAINHKIRKVIIGMLEEQEGMTVTDIYIKLRIEQSVASQHLAILRKAGIVNTKRTGKYIHYSLNNERLAQVNKLVENLAS